MEIFEIECKTEATLRQACENAYENLSGKYSPDTSKQVLDATNAYNSHVKDCETCKKLERLAANARSKSCKFPRSRGL